MFGLTTAGSGRFIENRGTIITHDRFDELKTALERSFRIGTRKNRRRVLVSLRRLHAAPRPLSS